MTQDFNGPGVEHPLVQDYLERLRDEAARLPADQAHELYADIREHLQVAILDTTSEAEVRQRLDRVGTPAQLVAEVADEPTTDPTAARSAGPASSRGTVETAALVCLVAAEVLFFVVPLATLGWIAGLVLLGISSHWSGRLKVRGYLSLGTGFPILLSAGALAFGVAGSSVQSCSSSSEVRPDGTVVDLPTVCTESGGTGVWLPILLGLVVLAYFVWQALTIRALLRRP